MVTTRKKILSFCITALGLVVLFLVAVNTGSLKITPLQLLKGLFAEYDPDVATVYDLRFPRIFIAMLGGAAMAVSGVLLQAVMKNPLADPGVIGISSGASLTAVLVTAFLLIRCLWFLEDFNMTGADVTRFVLDRSLALFMWIVLVLIYFFRYEKHRETGLSAANRPEG